MSNLAAVIIGLSVVAGVIAWNRLVGGGYSRRPSDELELPRWLQLYSVLVGGYMIYGGVTDTHSPVDGLLIAPVVVGGMYYLLAKRTPQQ